MRRLIEASAEKLRADAPVFTRRNLFHEIRRASEAPISEAPFDSALRRRLLRGPLPGLLPPPSARPHRLARGWDATFPKAVLLVDRRAIADLFAASGTIPISRLAVVCLDGTPAPVVAWLERGFRAGSRIPFLYLHDAATVIYPFSIEPLASLVRYPSDEPIVYRDLGLPPIGATPRRFGDAALPREELLFELEAIPPAALLRYCAEAADRLASGGPRLAADV